MMNLEEAKDFAVTYLEAMESRDLEAARKHVVAVPRMTFPGGKEFNDIAQIAKNSTGRYKFIRKNIARRDAWQCGAVTCVLISGTLYGEWPDGAPFEGVRFTDRFEIVDGKISRQEVWNDAGERILSMQREAPE